MRQLNGNGIFREFFKALDEPAILIDEGYRIIDANAAYLKALGLRKSRILGAACYKFVSPSNPVKRPCVPCPAMEALKSGKPSTIIRRENGGYTELKGIRISKGIAAEVIRDISGTIELKGWLEEKTTTIGALERIMERWTEAKTPKDILATVCDYILAELGYKMVWVGLVEKDSPWIKPVFSRGFEEGYLSSIKVRWNDSPLGKGPTGMAIKSGKPRIMRNISKNPDYEPWREEAKKRGYKSSASFPLVSKGKAIGALNIYSERPDSFEKKEVETLKRLSFYAAVAVENAMFIEDVRKSQKEWEATFDSIADPIFIHDGEYKVIKANKSYQSVSGLSFADIIGKPYWEIFPKRDGPLPSCRRAVESGDGLKVTEELSLPSGQRFLFDGFPIRMDDRPPYFVHVLKNITKLIGAQEKIKDEARTTQSLLEFATNIGRLLDLGAIFEEASKTLMNLIGAEKTAIFFKTEDEDSFRPVVFHGWPEHIVPLISTLRLRPGELHAMDLVLKGEDIGIEDALMSELMDRVFVETFGLRAVAASPFITGDGVLGAIFAERREKFTGRERQILRGIASNTAIAAENAKLYKESIDMAADLARRMETIRTTYTIDRTILSTLDRKEILEVAAKNTQRIVPADKVFIATADEKAGGYLYKSGVIPSGSSPLLDSVIKTGRVVSIPDLTGYRHVGPVISDLIREGLGSLIALPLFTKGKRFGSIVMASKRIAAFDKEDISNGEKMTAQIAIALENAKLYEDIKDLFISIVTALVNAVDAKSPWTRGHSERVTELALIAGRELGLDEEEMERLKLAGLLHDIGKIGTFDIVLDKPGKLTDEEFKLVKAHPGRGVEIISPIKQLKNIIPIIRSHHERMDGRGYPDGLAGEAIPLLARILCVADSYDSMTADRPYRPAPGREFAVNELRRCSGSQFDPNVVRAFLRTIKEPEQRG